MSFDQPLSNHTLFRRAFLAAFSFLATFSIAHADIPSWRNQGNGLFPAASLPTDWESNILYKTPLPEWSNGTPIMLGDRLYFTAEPADLICADRKTGRILWSRSNDYADMMQITDADRKRVAEMERKIQAKSQEGRRLRNDMRRLERALDRNPENQETKRTLAEKTRMREAVLAEVAAMREDSSVKDFMHPATHETNGFSSYSPVSDGERIFAAFGLGVIASYDLDGNRLWIRRYDWPDHRFGGSTMPLLVDGKLIIRFEDYAALNPDNGDIIWRAPSDVVFGTPKVFQVEGVSFLFTSRGEVIRVSDGKVMQKGLVEVPVVRDWAVFNTPTLVDGVLYTVNGVEGEHGDAYAFRIPKTLEKLEKSGLEPLWHTEVEPNRYYASTLIHEDLMYIITRENLLTVLEAATGKVVYTQKITGSRGTSYPSMISDGKHIFVGIDDGTLVVMKPGRKYQEIARNNVGAYRSTPIVYDNIAYLRTYDFLKAIGSSDS